MKQNGKKRVSAADKTMNLIVVLIILVVLALGVYAVYGPVSTRITEKAIENGESEPTIAYLAEQAGMSAEDYLAQYNLTLGDTLTEKSTQSEMIGAMTLESYLTYSGSEETADDIIQEYNLGDKVTKDTLYNDFIDILYDSPVSLVLGDEKIAEVKAEYGFTDEELSGDTTYSDFMTLVQNKQSELDAQTSDTEPVIDPDAIQVEGGTVNISDDAAGAESVGEAPEPVAAESAEGEAAVPEDGLGAE